MHKGEKGNYISGCPAEGAYIKRADIAHRQPQERGREDDEEL